jgi:hypothetical protein
MINFCADRAGPRLRAVRTVLVEYRLLLNPLYEALSGTSTGLQAFFTFLRAFTQYNEPIPNTTPQSAVGRACSFPGGFQERLRV